MRRAVVVVACVSCLLVVGTGAVGWAQGQEESDYDAWMKEVGRTNQSLRRNLDARSGEPAAADARRLVDLLGQAEGFWQRRNRNDAVRFSQDAQAGFRQVAEHAAANRFDEAGQAVQAAASNCMNCHEVYRERAPDGSWRMKQQ